MFDAIFDSNVLIDFAFASSIDVLADCFGLQARIAERIQTVELKKGLLNGLPDPCKRQDGSSWLTVLDDLDSNEYQLADDITLRLGEHHRGEAESIAISNYRRFVFVSRDGAALRMALNHGCCATTTTGVLNEIIRAGKATEAEVVRIATAMIPRGIDPKNLVS